MACVVAVGAWDNNSACPPTLLVPTGTVLSIQPVQHLAYNYTVANTLTGIRYLYMILSSDNPMLLYIMTPGQYTAFNSTGTTSSYVWASGQVTRVDYGVSCGATYTCSANLPGFGVGSYYFVLSNPSTTQTAKVTVQEQIKVGSC